MEQLDLNFEGQPPMENPALWTARDIYTRLNQRWLEYFKEDRRFERKGGATKDTMPPMNSSAGRG